MTTKTDEDRLAEEYAKSENQKPPSPWAPPKDRVELAHLAKAVEEAGELAAILGRIMCQGADGTDPGDGSLNRHRLEEEIGDVFATCNLLISRYHLNAELVYVRCQRKQAHKRAWFRMLEDGTVPA